MNKITINQDLCKGCRNCYLFCPKQVFSFASDLNGNGYRPACVANSENCNLCLNCSLMCPEGIIEIYKGKKMLS